METNLSVFEYAILGNNELPPTLRTWNELQIKKELGQSISIGKPIIEGNTVVIKTDIYVSAANIHGKEMPSGQFYVYQMKTKYLIEKVNEITLEIMGELCMNQITRMSVSIMKHSRKKSGRPFSMQHHGMSAILLCLETVV